MLRSYLQRTYNATRGRRNSPGCFTGSCVTYLNPKMSRHCFVTTLLLTVENWKKIAKRILFEAIFILRAFATFLLFFLSSQKFPWLALTFIVRKVCEPLWPRRRVKLPEKQVKRVELALWTVNFVNMHFNFIVFFLHNLLWWFLTEENSFVLICLQQIKMDFRDVMQICCGHATRGEMIIST